jgi:hypothetical protein
MTIGGLFSFFVVVVVVVVVVVEVFDHKSLFVLILDFISSALCGSILCSSCAAVISFNISSKWCVLSASEITNL